jgi:hypothetical protein
MNSTLTKVDELDPLRMANKLEEYLEFTEGNDFTAIERTYRPYIREAAELIRKMHGRIVRLEAERFNAEFFSDPF